MTRSKATLEESHQEIDRLKVLVEASKLINSSIEPAVLYSSILSVAKEQLGVERGTLYFVDERLGEIWARIPAEGEISEIRLPIGRGIAGSVAATGEAVILNDVTADPRFDGSIDRRSGFHTRSMLCVPIKNRVGRTVGVLQLLNKIKGGDFGASDVDFLSSVSDHMAIAMENATLHLHFMEKDRMERELALGREIQKRLLADPPAEVHDTDLAAASRSCYEVGGDYYDFLPLEGGDLGLAIGDVSGKGVAAALIMTSLQAAIRVTVPLEMTLTGLFERLNGLIYEMTGARKYVTLFCGRYFAGTGRLRYVNAGHNPPLLFSNGDVQSLGATGKPIGLLPGLTFQVAEVAIPKGATLLLYTDGLTEATNPADEELGLEGLANLARRHLGEPPEVLVRSLLEGVTAFEAGNPPSDDKTLVVLRRR